MIALLAAAALAYPPDDLERRRVDAEALRSQRLAEHAPAIPADAYLTAAGGEVATGLEKVDGQAAKKAWGVGIVDVGIGPLFSAINDDANKIRFTKLETSRVLSGEPCADRVVFQFLPVPLVSDRWWVIEQTLNGPLQSASDGRVREMVWSSVADMEARLDDPAKYAAGRGVPVAFTHGGWWLVELDEGHTLVEFWTWADPGGSLPAGPVSSFSAGGIAHTISAMAELAREGPSCSL